MIKSSGFFNEDPKALIFGQVVNELILHSNVSRNS